MVYKRHCVFGWGYVLGKQALGGFPEWPWWVEPPQDNTIKQRLTGERHYKPDGFLWSIFSCGLVIFNEIFLLAFYMLLFIIGMLLCVLVNGHNFKILFCFLSWIVIKSIMVCFECFCCWMSAVWKVVEKYVLRQWLWAPTSSPSCPLERR